MTNKTFFLDQHGCAKNQVDGELIISRLSNLGYVRTEDPSAADLIIVNSCGFIESAKTESIDSVMAARRDYPNAKILLAGCLAERYAKEFKEQLLEADGIFGNGDISQIDSTVASLFNGERPVVTPPQEGVCCGDRNTLLSLKGSAYVKITEGCNNRCTFCAIPIIRGDLRSRKAGDIVDEIRDLVKRGVKEINLIGQDLAAYGCGSKDDVFGDGTNGYDSLYHGGQKLSGKSYLARLIEMISHVEGTFWVRLLYIHPDHFNADILEEMKKDPRFLPYFDIPFQSGDDDVIHAMNRKGTFSSYKQLVDTIRSSFDDACIRTTFLTGFPGETKEQASRTAEFLAAIESDWSGCFPYSREDDTPAQKMKKQVPAPVAKKRAAALEEIQASITAERLKRHVGKTYDVLIEEIIENKNGTDDGFAIGRAWFDAPEVDGNVVVTYDLDDKDAVASIVPGAVVKVKIHASSAVDVDGEYIGL